MRIPINNSNEKKAWMYHEIMSSILTDDEIYRIVNDGYCEVTLLINGVEHEPTFYNDIMEKINQYIDAAARQLVEDRFYEWTSQFHKLEEVVRETIETISPETVR